MITKIEEGLRGCKKCGKPYKNLNMKGVFINKCAECTDIGNLTAEVKSDILPMLRTTCMTWKKLVTVMRKHKLTFKMVSEMVKGQKDRCARCEERLTGTPYFDHDHACCTSQKTCGLCLRGIVCARCNLMMAGYDDYVKNPEQTDRYLSSYRKQRAKKMCDDSRSPLERELVPIRRVGLPT
jgi:hypothetical protein